MIFTLGGMVGALASQGYALAPDAHTEHFTQSAEAECTDAVLCGSVLTLLRRPCYFRRGTSQCVTHCGGELHAFARYGLVKWDGDILYNSALHSLNGRLAGISEDVRAWGGALPICGCLYRAVLERGRHTRFCETASILCCVV